MRVAIRAYTFFADLEVVGVDIRPIGQELMASITDALDHQREESDDGNEQKNDANRADDGSRQTDLSGTDKV